MVNRVRAVTVLVVVVISAVTVTVVLKAGAQLRVGRELTEYLLETLALLGQATWQLGSHQLLDVPNVMQIVDAQ